MGALLLGAPLLAAGVLEAESGTVIDASRGSGRRDGVTRQLRARLARSTDQASCRVWGIRRLSETGPRASADPHRQPPPQEFSDRVWSVGEPVRVALRVAAVSRISVGTLRAAFDAGFAEHEREIAEIAGNLEPPTFDNTVAALERAGHVLRRTELVYSNLCWSQDTAELRELEAQINPRLAAHADQIWLNATLFTRLRAVLTEPGLDSEALRLVRRYHLDFVRAGAALDAPAARRLTELNQELAGLTTTFAQQLLAINSESALLVDDIAELDGLTEPDIDAAADAARAAGHRSGYLIAMVAPTVHPFLGRLTNRETRRRLWEAGHGRGRTGAHRTLDVAARIASLRAERAQLLGFASHADYVTADTTAGSAAAVDALLDQLVAPAVEHAKAEAAQLVERAAADGVDLQPWDWRFYSGRIRAERYHVDHALLRPYLELNRVLQDGVFAAASRIYGVEFDPREDLTGYAPDVRVFEVRDADDSSIGLLLLDLFARPDKRTGAWMSSFVEQNRLLGQQPVVVLNLNVTKPPPGEAALLVPDEVRTLFHEFGHALHGLFSQVTYPRFSGTSVPGDVVEFPSQVNEVWAWRPELLHRYAVHHQTGEALPDELVTRLAAAQRWGTGYDTVEYLAATLLDQAWHRLPAGTVIGDPVEFERVALSRAGIDLALVPPRYRTGYFQHIFSGGYSAGYYFYIWADVLAANCAEWFVATDLPPREVGDRFRSAVLSVGGTADLVQAVTALLGHPPTIAPLLRARGLA